jgi:hypothetical protein
MGLPGLSQGSLINPTIMTFCYFPERLTGKGIRRCKEWSGSDIGLLSGFEGVKVIGAACSFVYAG